MLTPDEMNTLNKLLYVKTNHVPRPDRLKVKNFEQGIKDLKEITDDILDLNNPALDLNTKDLVTVTHRLHRILEVTPPSKVFNDKLHKMAESKWDATMYAATSLIPRGGTRRKRRRKRKTRR